MNRRNLIRIAAALAAAPFISPMAMAQSIDVEAILNDPEAPAGGNPKGDVTIVAFLDYNCPYCKKSAPDLARVVREDGKIRLVYKNGRSWANPPSLRRRSRSVPAIRGATRPFTRL